MKQYLSKAFKITSPIIVGYLFLGSAFGILIESSGFPMHVALLMSVFIYSGAMQFAAVPLLINPITFLQTIILTLSINARHLFYGVSMVKPLENAGKKKEYLIFSITDESYSLLANYHDNIDLMFWVDVLCQGYWVIGTVFGYYFGRVIPFTLEGIEFSMVAVFIIIFLDKLKEGEYFPIMVGLISSIVSILIFGKQHFIIPSMILILLVLFGKERN